MNFPRILAGALFVGFACQLYAQAPPTVVRTPMQPSDPTSGPEMFNTYCAVCHGPTGVGNGPAATALKTQPADLTQLSKKNGGKFPDLRVMNVIKGADVMASHGSRDMPVWGKIFSEREGQQVATLRISNLTKYVESLQK
jgi:mono/diheme cytochrome c family protein